MSSKLSLKTSKKRCNKISSPRPSRLQATPPVSPTLSSQSSTDIPGGQISLIDYLEDSLITSLEVREGFVDETPTTHVRLSESDFKLVKSLAEPVAKLTAAKGHITHQISILSKAISTNQPPPFLKNTVKPPHPHREFNFSSAFNADWNRLNNKASLLFAKLSLQEYNQVSVEIETKLNAAKKESRERLAQHFNGAELRTSIHLLTFFTRPRQPTRGKKRKRETK